MVTFYRRLPKFDYLSPRTIAETLALLSQHKAKAKVVAGGTDLVPKLKRREIKTAEYIIDLKNLAGLDYIKHDEKTGLKIGALATIHAVEASRVIKQKFGILWQAAYSMASTQVRNRATIAGNICNAVPSADTAPALLALGAKLKLVSKKGKRTIPINNFFVGLGKTALSADEILQEIQIPDPPANAKGIYLKLSPRKTMDLAVVGVGVVVILDGEMCKDMRIALGAVAPTPIRAKRAEAVGRGKKLNDEVIANIAKIAAEESKPISDHRASAEYRKDMVEVLTKRAIKEAIRS